MLIIITFLCSAACKLKLKEFDVAVEKCNEVLQVCGDNAKALYRLGQALHGKRSYTEALEVLGRASKLAPSDGAIQKEVAAVKREVQHYKQQEKMVYSKLFA